MNAQTWMIIGIVGFSLAVLLLFAAVLVFVRLNIPAVLGDLTGRTAKKQVQKIRRDSAAAAEKAHQRPQAYEWDQAAPTRRGELEWEEVDAAMLGGQAENGAAVTEGLEGATEMLGPDAAATAILEPDAADATVILSDAGATEPLFPPSPQTARMDGAAAFRLVRSVVVTHTDEVIE